MPATNDGPFFLLAPPSGSPRLGKQVFSEYSRVCEHVISLATPGRSVEAVVAAYGPLIQVRFNLQTAEIAWSLYCCCTMISNQEQLQTRSTAL
jgi:hypothetical protein